MKDEKLALSISVRELVEFIMRSGDIDNRTTSQVGIEAMLEGSRLHKWIQDSMDDNYHPEVSMKTIWDATRKDQTRINRRKSEPCARCRTTATTRLARGT